MSKETKSNDFPKDLKFKVNKKIAQLTKVIYQLHTQHADRDDEASQISRRYEAEMATVISDATQRIAAFKTMLDSTNEQNRTEELLQSLTDKHEKEKNQFLAEFDQFKKNSQEKVLQIQTNHSDQISKFNSDLLKLKNQWDNSVSKSQSEITRLSSQVNDLKAHNSLLTNQLSDMQQALTEASSSSESTIKLIASQEKERFEKERQRFVHEHNEKYNTMLARFTEEIDHLEEENRRKDSELQESQRKSSENLIEISKLTEILEKSTEDINLLKKQLIDATSSSSSSLADLNSSLELKKLEVNDLRSKIGVLTADNQGLVQNLNNYERQCKELSQDNESLRSNFIEKSRELDDISEKFNQNLQEKDENITLLKSDLDALTSKFENISAKYSNLKSESEGYFNDINILKETLSKNTLIVNDLQSKMMKLENEKRELSDKLSNQSRLIAQLESGDQNAAQTITDLKGKVVELESKITDYENTIKSLQSKEAQNSAEITRLGQKVQDLSSINDSLSSNLQQRIDNENKLKRELENFTEINASVFKDLEAQNSEFSVKISRLETDLQNETQNRIKFENLYNSLQETNQIHKSKLIALEKELTGSSVTTMDQKILIGKLQGNISNLEQQLKKSKEEISNLSTTINQMKERHINELNQLNKHHDDVMKEESIKYDEQTRYFNQKLMDEKINFESKLNARIDEINANSNNNLSKLQQEVDMLNKILHSMKDEKTQLQLSFSSKERDLMAASDKIMKEFENNCQAKINEIETQCNEKISEFEKQCINKVNEITEKKDKEIQKLKDLFGEQIRAIEISHKANLEAQRVEFEKELKNQLTSQKQKLTEEFNKEKADMEAQHEEVMKKKKQEYKEVVEQHKQKYISLEQKYGKGKRKIDDLENTITTLNNQIDSLKQELSNSELRFNNAVEEELKRHSKLMEFHEERHKTEISALVEQYNDRIRRLQDELGGAQFQSDSKIEELQREIRSWEERFIRREPRQEDLDMISDLQSKLIAKERDLSKAIQEMQFFKMELINREEGYNKVFNRNPNVGVVNPLSVSTSRNNKSSLPPLTRASSSNSMRR
ncbi:hypothetical protein RCL1_006823 [Eukaryota sp. TZLM3-RCL]